MFSRISQATLFRPTLKIESVVRIRRIIYNRSANVRNEPTSPKEVTLEENKLPPGGIHQDPSIEVDPLLQPTSPVPPSAPVMDGMILPITTQPGTQMQPAIPHCPPGLENLYGVGRLVVNLETIEKVRSNILANKYKKFEVLLTSGTVIGTIKERKTLFHPEFDIRDQHGQPVLIVRNTTPFGTCKLTGDVIYYIFGMDGTEIGKLSKKYDECHSFSITFPLDLDVRVKATLLGALFMLHYVLSEIEHGKPREIRPLCL